jgi:hypothetical protein
MDGVRRVEANPGNLKDVISFPLYEYTLTPTALSTKAKDEDDSLIDDGSVASMVWGEVSEASGYTVREVGVVTSRWLWPRVTEVTRL